MNYPVVEWVRQNSTINTVSDNLNPIITSDNLGNIYITYYTFGTASGQTKIGSGGSTDIVILKMNSSGVTEWVRQNSFINTLGSDSYPKIASDLYGNIYITYYTNGISSGQSTSFGQDIVVVKINSSGVTEWVRQNSSMNTPSNDRFPAITTDSFGNVYVAYFTNGTASGQIKLPGEDIIIFKLNSSGTTEWVRQNSNMNTGGFDQNPSISADSSGNIYVSYGTTGTSSGEKKIGTYDCVVFKMDSSGTVLWVRQNPIMNTLSSVNLTKITTDTYGNSYVAYYTLGTSSGQTSVGDNDIIVFKINSSGTVEWVRQNSQMNTIQSDTEPSISVDSSGYIYISYKTLGTSSGQFNTGSSDIVVFKMNPSGTVEWIQQNSIMNTSTDDVNSTLTIDSNRNIYVAYSTIGTSSGQSITAVDNIEIVVFKLRQSPLITNSVPVTTGSSYLTVGSTLLFTQAAVEALQADSDLPVEPLASWLPEGGLPAGSLLRDLKKTVVVTRNKLHIYKFRLVQLIDGPATEGVGGTASDVEPYRCGYVCTWTASGIPFNPIA